ncbi:MAG: hypothetical protein ACRELY_13475 [Polyangiaceae bacterium]
MRNRKSRSLVFLAVLAAAAACSGSALADDTIKSPGDHPDYTVEIEPHGLVGFGFRYGGAGLGVGARFSINIVKNGFIPSINNSVAVSFGADFMHYGGCYSGFNDGIGCNANFLFFPVALQWNFYVASHWSVFGEPGIVPFYGFYDDFCGNGVNQVKGCDNPSHFSVAPALYLGGRYYFNEHTALTMRIGYPNFSIGVSFL